MTRLLGSIAAVAGAAVALAACGGDKSDDGGGGPTIAGTGYQYTLPDGWVDARDRVGDQKPDTVVAVDSESPVASSINVVTQDAAPGTTLDTFLQTSMMEIRRAAADSPSPTLTFTPPDEPTPTRVDGTRAVRFDYGGASNGVRSKARRLVALRGSTAYSITLASGTSTFASGRRALERVLDSWEWR
jgi:hypothetical protein